MENTFETWASELNMSPELYGFTNYIRQYVQEEHGYDLPEIFQHGSKAWNSLSSTAQLQYSEKVEGSDPQKPKSLPKRKPAICKAKTTAAARKRKRSNAKPKLGCAGGKRKPACRPQPAATKRGSNKMKTFYIPVPVAVLDNIMHLTGNGTRPLDLDELPTSTMRPVKKVKATPKGRPKKIKQDLKQVDETT